MPLVVADALGLMALRAVVPPDQLVPLLGGLADRLISGELCCPRETFDHLVTLDRDDTFAIWTAGLADTKNRYKPDAAFARSVMTTVQNKLGYDEGLAILDHQGDPELLHVARLVFERLHLQHEVVVLTGDTGEVPLRPTMEQFCVAENWRMITPQDALELLDLP